MAAGKRVCLTAHIRALCLHPLYLLAARIWRRRWRFRLFACYLPLCCGCSLQTSSLTFRLCVTFLEGTWATEGFKLCASAAQKSILPAAAAWYGAGRTNRRRAFVMGCVFGMRNLTPAQLRIASAAGGKAPLQRRRRLWAYLPGRDRQLCAASPCSSPSGYALLVILPVEEHQHGL